VVRADRKSPARRGEEAPSVALRRRGLLQRPQRDAGSDDPLSPEDAAVLFKMTLAFARAMVRNSCSQDIIVLAARAAKAEVAPTERQLVQFAKAVSYEYARRCWPPGF
jgi:hypothetical protein